MDKFIGIKLDGRYEITELIGVGGMSDVYKGVDIMENRTIAVKILKREFAENEEFVRYFRNESRAIAVLSHPNIVKIFDVGYEQDMQYIVMEYIDGITLKECIEHKGLIQWRDCVHYTIQILRALQLAHDRGIVHRDIKPQNVMLLSDGTIKVMDFGIARFSRQSGNDSSEKTMGSVHYVSPEQARGDRTDERSDIYSVGVMMYEMLTGRKPFDGDTPVAVALKHMNEEPVKPSEYISSFYPGLEEIILRAMEKDPDKRYQSASGMIMDIEAFKNDQSITFGYFDDTVKRFDPSAGSSGSKKLLKHTEKAKPERKDGIMNKITSNRAKRRQEPEYEYYDEEEDYDDYDEPRRNYILPILAAVTVTVIIVATLFVANVILTHFKTTPSSANDYIMPNLVGMNYYDARSQYPNIQLLAQEEFNSEYVSGIITEQEKAEGRIVKIGDVIRVVVSKGTRMITVPDVVNYHYNSAHAALTGENLNVMRIEIESDDVASGYVVKTDPAAYSSVEEGSTVKVYVSIGPSTEDTVVPDVQNHNVIEAEDMLKEAFLNPKIQYVESSEPKDMVISQNIAAGDSVTRNTTVTIYVSDGTGIAPDPFDDTTIIDDNPANPGQDNPGSQFEAPTVTDQMTLMVQIPATATKTYYISVYNVDTSEEISEVVFFNSSNYAGMYLPLIIKGEGQMTVSVTLKSPRTGMRTELVQYNVDFENGSCSEPINYYSFAFTLIDLTA